MKFLKDFEKEMNKVDGVSSTSAPPRYWFSTGCFALNRIISNSYIKGIPQGRVTGLAGPSGAGKSFVLGNIIRQAQDEGAFGFVVDSENAFDDDFARGIGINVEPDSYNYKSIVTIPQASKVVSSFISGYRKEYGDDPDSPKVIIGIDSLDMMLTDTEFENFNKGKTKGDQGQRAKQLKAMLRTFVQSIKDLNISIVVTSQVYAATQEQIFAGEGKWVVNGAVRFSLSQILLLTKLKLKSDDKSEITGIRMKAEGFKTRFTKPFQTIEIEVPYDTGMDPYSGMFDIGKQLGIIEQSGKMYSVNKGKTFLRKDMTEDHFKEVLAAAEEMSTSFLKAKIEDAEEVTISKQDAEEYLKEKLEARMFEAEA